MPEEPEFRYKQCLIIRNDIKMSCGKKCAQIAHASVSAFDKSGTQVKKAWHAEGQKKVVLKVQNERDLYELKSIAEAADIAAVLIRDAGMTEIPPGTVTALGLGPALSEELDRITSNLSLL